MSTKTVQVKPLTLQSSIGTSNTTAVVTGMVGLDGLDLAQSDFGSIIYGTFEPNTAREEAVSFTITSNTDGVANIDFGVGGRGLIGKSPYGTGGIAYTHSAGVKLVISNNPNLFNKFTAKDNDEVVTGAWEFPTPTTDDNPVTKSYLESVAVLDTGDQTIAGEKTFSTAPKIPDGVAVEEALTVGQSNIIEATNVKLTGNQTVAGVKTFSSSPIIPDATTAQQPISKAQFDAAGESFSATASDTVRGTTKLDVAADNPLDPKALTATKDRVDALAGGGDFGTPSGDNKFVTEELTRPIQIVTFTSSGTWTKDAGLKYVVVEVVGGGGGSGGATDSGSNGGGGGGGGGYGRRLILASTLGSTETVTIGSGGTAGTSSTPGGSGGTTSFGSLVQATGGDGGVSTGSGGVGGVGSLGDVNTNGQGGGAGGSGVRGGLGGNSFFGGGASSATVNNVGRAGTDYGGGASGGSSGNGSGYRAGAAGADGIVIVTEYYS